MALLGLYTYMGKSILRPQNKLVSHGSDLKKTKIWNKNRNNLCTSASSTGGCFGTHGGGCALVIRSMSATQKKKSFKVFQNIPKTLFYLQSRTREKWNKSADVELSSSAAGDLALRSGLGRVCELLGGFELRAASVLNTPCDYSRGAQPRTHTHSTPSHEPHVLDGAFNSSPSPRGLARAHKHARAHVGNHSHTHSHSHSRLHPLRAAGGHPSWRSLRRDRSRVPPCFCLQRPKSGAAAQRRIRGHGCWLLINKQIDADILSRTMTCQQHQRYYSQQQSW